MHHPTDRIAHTTAFVTPVVEHWLKRNERKEQIIYAWMYTYIQINMHALTHTYMHTCMHTYMHACIHTYIHTYMHACMHAHLHTYMCMHFENRKINDRFIEFHIYVHNETFVYFISIIRRRRECFI